MLDFKASGYIEVWRDGVKVSQHRQEREAIESVLRDSATRPSGVYEIRFPMVRVTYTAPVPVPDPEPPPAGEINGGGPFAEFDAQPSNVNPATWAQGVSDADA